MRIYTHAVPLAGRLLTRPAVDLHLLPGRVRTTMHAALGPDTVEALGRQQADEAATKRAMIGAARRVVVLADASKVGFDSTVCFATLAQVDVLVTDNILPSHECNALERAGLKVVLAWSSHSLPILRRTTRSRSPKSCRVGASTGRSW